ncbi:DUF2515 family protein [Radiobacillus deserti]|uniref:DUF2515 family protein n=1 Tax=Radiobacillus deserti TaxID=2594883 RepID=UPI0013159DE5|nr:DUF2515 family protein [Radiobacillus deserti]
MPIKCCKVLKGIKKKETELRWNDEISFQTEKVNRIKLELKKGGSLKKIPTAYERLIIDSINRKTRELNKNNITRTNAYFQFYLSHPEVHWAFLASMVSRNAGYNMTDLKGSLIPSYLGGSKVDDFFSFLERSNALIFQDAYPQLLLYEKSKEVNQDLTYLLPHFYVTQFMQPFWSDFIRTKDSQFLTLALIINEQNYIQKRVMEKKRYKERVLDTITFKTQELFHFSKVIFPFFQDEEIRLTGVTVTDFHNLKERIQIGKTLYSILFRVNPVFNGALAFASKCSHTGSRADYWPFSFTTNRILPRDGKEVCSKDTPPLIRSPKLEEVWPNIAHSFHDQSDWYRDTSMLEAFSSFRPPKDYLIEEEYCTALETLYNLSKMKSEK